MSSVSLSLAQKPTGRTRVAAPTTAAAAPQAPTTVAAARMAGPGATVTVRGIITNGPELGQLRFVQDQEAGLAVFSTTSAALQALVPGDSVLLTGTLKDYKGLLEMDPVAQVVKLAAGRRVTALEVAAADLSAAFVEANEGRLLRIKGLSRLTTTGGTAATKLAGNANYLLDGQPETPIRINVASTGEQGVVDQTPPPGSFDLIGSLSQFTQSGTGGYQLLPRTFADFVVAGGLPVIAGEPLPTNIYRNGFTVLFQTVNPGTAKVEYGRSSQLGQVVTLKELATSHRVELEDLEPNTTYYVRVSATNAVGTSSSPPVPILTDNKKRPNR
ncbi:hypothetical protein D0T11_11825 [Hymenobacter rubripertinctus]|uniref:Fibronectin type-III domain-containing protein n=1 Tax=Hymenobacter rubripertinctus TaxID=2029981 RepID=A0A418QXG6_9BACT|nr:hypothetical protein D0T11_11825 [Hymenobacter rubripertinctus]